MSQRVNWPGRKRSVCVTGFVRHVLWLALGLILVVGCDQEPTPTATVTEVESTAVAIETESAETRTLPTIYPTPSDFPTPLPTEPLPTSTPRPTATPIDFSELVVEVRYAIPGLGLERTVRGNVSSHLEVTDETTDQTVTVSNVPGVMFELQQTLPETTLGELPEGCELCVELSYELFITGESDEGWLEDTVLLASFENFFAAHLGPHFPPDTVVGLRRSATPYNVAHTVAVTAGGDLWRWTATESEVAGSEDGDGTLNNLLDEIDVETIEQEYFGPCSEGAGLETLFLENESGEMSVEIICPELALPLPLMPLYLELDALADEKTADEALPQPEPTVSLDSVLYYQREDGRRLTFFSNGRAQARDENGLTASAALTGTDTISTALALAGSDILHLGVVNLVSGEADNILIARGLDGVYEIGWNNTVPDNLADFVGELDDLMDDLLENVETVDEGTPTATPDPDATPGTVTPTPTEASEETPEATPEE